MSKATRLFLRGAAVAMLAFSLLGVPSAWAQHGEDEWGKIELVGQLTVSDVNQN